MDYISTRTIYTNNWMTVREDEVLHDNGSTGIFGIVVKPDFSVVVPHERNGVFLVEQYRYAAGARFWEFPQGAPASLQSTLSPLQIAQAELAEETGIRAAKMKLLGIVHEAYGYATQRAHVFLATGLHQGPPAREESETDMKCEWFSFEDMWRLVDEGRLTDAPSLAAIALLGRHSGVGGIFASTFYNSSKARGADL